MVYNGSDDGEIEINGGSSICQIYEVWTLAFLFNFLFLFLFTFLFVILRSRVRVKSNVMVIQSYNHVVT